MRIKQALFFENFLANGKLIALLGALAGFYLIPVTSEIGKNLLTQSCNLLALFGLIGLRRSGDIPQNRMLSFALLGFGLNILLWNYLYRQSGDFHLIYSIYAKLGKALLVTSLLVYLFSNYPLRAPTWLIGSIAIVGGLVINIAAIVNGLENPSVRVTLSLQHSTTVAFIFNAFDILMMYATTKLKSPWRIPLLMLEFGISYGAIILSGTRPAFFIYPIIAVALLAMESRANKNFFVTLLFTTLVMATAVLYAFKPMLFSRMDALDNDIRKLQASDSTTSFGSRFAMLQAAWHAGIESPLGQSAEQRAAIITKKIEANPLLEGARPFLTNHMHNEFLETFSERGVPGVAILAWLFYALVATATQKQQRNTSLLLITVSMFFYGMSDVIFYKREGYLVYLFAIFFSIVFAQNHTTEQRRFEQDVQRQT